MSCGILASIEETVNGSANRYQMSLIIGSAVQYPRPVATKL
jgi:hypothetical protein